MSKIIIAAIICLLISPSFAQVDNSKKTKEKSSDVFTEVENGELSLRFFDALNGEPIEGAAVKIGQLEEKITDFNGRVFFSTKSQDKEMIIEFSHAEYIPSKFNIEILAGTLFFNRFSISPKIDVGKLRVILDWGEYPEDLDAHLVKKGDYHISYRNMTEDEDGEAILDRDDTESFGPETITVNRVDQSASYEYYIHDYSNRSNSSSTELANSKASIKVYGGSNELLKVINVPPDLVGNRWNVFKIVNGKIL